MEKLHDARLDAHALQLAAFGKRQRTHTLNAAGNDDPAQMRAAGKRHLANLLQSFGQDDAPQFRTALKRPWRNGGHGTCARLKLNIQIIRLSVDAAHGGQRSVSVVGKIHDMPSHHRAGRSKVRILRRTPASLHRRTEAVLTEHSVILKRWFSHQHVDSSAIVTLFFIIASHA